MVILVLLSEDLLRYVYYIVYSRIFFDGHNFFPLTLNYVVNMTCLTAAMFLLLLAGALVNRATCIASSKYGMSWIEGWSLIGNHFIDLQLDRHVLLLADLLPIVAAVFRSVKLLMEVMRLFNVDVISSVISMVTAVLILLPLAAFPVSVLTSYI